MPIENRTKEEIKMKKLKNLKYMLEPNNNVVQEVQALGLLVSIS